MPPRQKPILNLSTAANRSFTIHIHTTTLSTTPKIERSGQRDPAYQTRQLFELTIRLNRRIGRLQNGPMMTQSPLSTQSQKTFEGQVNALVKGIIPMFSACISGAYTASPSSSSYKGLRCQGVYQHLQRTQLIGQPLRSIRPMGPCRTQASLGVDLRCSARGNVPMPVPIGWRWERRLSQETRRCRADPPSMSTGT
jgi:hypothetical protein